MRIDISCKYLERSEYVDLVLDKNLKKIERRLQIFKRDDPIHISIHLEKNPHKEQYFCRSQVYLPTSKVLAVQESGMKAETSINKTFLALNKQLDKLKYKVETHVRKK